MFILNFSVTTINTHSTLYKMHQYIKNLFAVITCLLFTSYTGFSQEKSTEVYIVSSLHKAHQVNEKYTYDSLYHYIERVQPDVIGIEIRKEEIDSSDAYLSNMYPLEMYSIRNKFRHLPVFGIDWLGSEIEGKAVPENYYDNFFVKTLQIQVSQDSVMRKTLSVLQPLRNEMNQIALKSNISEVNDGRYDMLSKIYYLQLKHLYQDTPYQRLSKFYTLRDEHIAKNIVEIVKKHPDKKLLFVVGADHRYFSKQYLLSELGGEIQLNDIK